MINIKDIEIVKTEENKNTKYKTSGFNNFGLSEIVINLPLDENLVKDIISSLVDIINTEGNLSEGYLKNKFTCPVYIKNKDNEKRIIFPDPFIRFPWDETCEAIYKNQL